MSTTTMAGNDAGTGDLRAKLRQVEDDLGQLRDERASLARDREQTKRAFAGLPSYDTESQEFKDAERAVAAVSAKDDEIARVQRDQVGLLKLAGGGDRAGDAVRSGDPRVTDRLKNEPGRWLASVLDRRKSGVHSLPDETRYKTLTVGDDVSTVDEGDAFIDLLSPASVAFASGIQRLDVDGTEVRVPRFTTLPEAGWVPELAAFPKSDPGLELVTSKPPKVGLVTGLSIEAFADLRPAVLAGVQTQMTRAVALALDAGILFGSGVGAEPRGVANTPGVATVSGPLTSLAPFAEAIAGLMAGNARPGALVMNPLDAGVLLQVVDEAGSNRPLWQAEVGSPDNLRLPFFGVPLFLSPAAPQGTALMYDPATIIGVVRKDVDVAVDPWYGFDNGEVGMRIYVRASVVVGQVYGAIKIEFTPVP